MANSFGTLATLNVGGKSYSIHRLPTLDAKLPQAERLPFSLKILLENLLRTEDGLSVKAADIEALANWDPKAGPDTEIAFTAGRVLLQDFTGVPCVVDLAAMRDAMKAHGRRPDEDQPAAARRTGHRPLGAGGRLRHADGASRTTPSSSIERNRERYAFLRWGQNAFRNFKVVPPETGIVHQVNLEYLARVVFVDDASDRRPTPTRSSAPTRTRR